MAAGFLTGVTALGVAGGMRLPAVLAIAGRLQLLPAAISFSLTIFIAWIAATLVLGRLYCSTVCPLGTVQDIAARAARLTPAARRRRIYRHKPGRTALRMGVLIVVLASLTAGVSIVPTLLDPFSAYTRFVTHFFRPAVSPVTTLTAGWIAGAVVALIVIAAVSAAAARGGRAVCNTVCPVGALLGLVSRHSLMAFDIDTDRCTQCRRCEHVCKASCIDPVAHVVDMSRCVVCFDCIDACNDNAISYTFKRHRLAWPMMQRIAPTPTATATTATADAATEGARLLDRRRFIAMGVVAALAPASARADNALGALRRAVASIPSDAIPPPGTPSPALFLNRCTGCGLCVAHCPTGVLQPSTTELHAVNALHPVMNFDASTCEWDCTLCTRVCPTGALLPVTAGEKHASTRAVAEVDPGRCIGCGVCARRCPAEAIVMTRLGDRRVPAISPDLCAGCGICRAVCPATPVKALNIIAR